MSGRSWFGWLAAIICFVLAATTTPAMAASGPPAVVSSAAAQPKVDSRPDRVSAMVTARAQKSRVESEADATPSSATFANPDGTWTTESYAGVVRSKTDAHTWVPVDPAVEKQGHSFEPKATPFAAQFSGGGDKALGSVTTPSDATITVGWPTKLPTPQADGSTLTYPDAAAPGSDLVVTSYGDGFNYSVVLDHAPAADAPALEYRIPLSFGGATPVVKADGSIILKDGKRQVASMSAPVMWDSATPSDGSDPQRVPVAASVEGTGDARTLVLKPDMDYLRDPTRTFPVTVDPTVLLGVSADTYVTNALLATSQYTAPELHVGSNNLGITKARSFMIFDYTPLYSMPPGVFTSAQVVLSNFTTGNCTGTAVRMSRITGPWSYSGITWSNQPSVATDGASTSTESHGATACPAEGTATFDATAIVNAWNQGATYYGVRFAADNESAATGYRAYRSVENTDPAKAPKLVYTYNAYPSTPTGLTVSPGYNGYASSLTPTLSATVSDPDGGAVRGYFEVKSGSTVVWSGTSGWATSGAQVQVTVPSGVLSDGPYTVTVAAHDASLTGPSSAAKSFTVDTTAPTVSINSPQFTNGGWVTPMPGSSSFNYHGTADTGAFAVTTDGVSYAPIAANSSGDLTYSWTPTPGWHVLEAAAIDKAGNRGPVTTFSFGTGPAAFTTPNPWSESTASFPLEVAGPANSTGATLSWQVVGESSWHAATQVTDTTGNPWSGSVTTTGGHSATGSLVWKATSEPLGTGTLSAPALVFVKACLHYTSAPDSCTAAWPVILTSSARGGNYPEAQVGPASVALYSGEAEISDTDAADSTAGLGRTFSAFSDSTLSAGLFGPGWSDPAILAAPGGDAKASVVDNRTKDGSFVIVDPDSGSQAFNLKPGSSTDYVPVHPTGDATMLTFTAGTGGAPDQLQLVRPLGSGSVTTTWTLKPSDTGGSPEWTADGVAGPGTSVPVTVASAAGSQRPVWVRESDPSASATCTATTQTVGCRGLKIAYTGTGAATRVAEVDRVIGAATQTQVITKTLATYSYDGTGKLSSVCSAVPAAGRPALCVAYTYTTVSGRTLLAQMTPPGLKPWRFGYDSIGRLTTVNREKPTGGDATWSVDYSLTPASAGLPDLSASTAAQWGQKTIPTKVFAVYAPFTGTADVTKADLYYTTANGTTTNTATYGTSGWLVDTSWYDAKGNQIQHLDPTGWARVQAAPAAQRPQVAADASSYTIYNIWGGADVAGTRVVDEYGPAHTASLKNGTTGLFRTHTHTMFDDDPNVDPALITATHGSTGLGLVVEQTSSTSDAARISDYDAVVTKYGYEPIVTGDGNGWTLGTPTTMSTQIDASTWSTQTTRFDTSGRQIETRQPGGAADGSGAGNDAHSTVTTYYTAAGSGDCGGKPAWDGLICKTGPAAQPTGPTIPTAFTSAYNEDLQPATVQETSGGDARTTTTTYDALGRPTAISKATSGSGVTNETIATSFGYDDTTGLQTTTSSGSSTVTTGYDTWGRQTSYADALGTSSATTYDAAGHEATFNDGTATYTYTYNSRGNLTSVDAGGGAGTFSYSFASNGTLDTVTYPNGMVATRAYDEIGHQTGLTYAQGTTTLLAFSTTQTAEGRMIGAASPESAQRYTYDGLGRLTAVQDTRPAGCTTRTYGFDSSSNRSTFASYAPGTNGVCQSTTTATSRSNTYDTAGRIRNSAYAYDTFGRTLITPQADAGPNAAGDLTASFHADDMVATLSQSVLNGAGGTDAVVKSYGLDPAERINTITSTANGAETNRVRYRFADDGDGPARVDVSTNGGSSWSSTRYIVAPGLGLAATASAGAVSLQLTNQHGDLVATMDAASGSSTLASYDEADEFGNTPAAQVRYRWLGAHQRSDDALGGLYQMGARLYNPVSGLFASADSILGGNLTNYTYPQDPINQSDLDGRGLCLMNFGWCSRDYIRHSGAIVHVRDNIWSKVTNYHQVPGWLVKKAIFYGHRVFELDNDQKGYAAYHFTVWDWYCNGTKCKRGTTWVQIRFYVNWVDGKADHGELVTMYCETNRGHVCPQWVQDLTPYYGPPGPQYW